MRREQEFGKRDERQETTGGKREQQQRNKDAQCAGVVGGARWQASSAFR